MAVGGCAEPEVFVAKAYEVHVSARSFWGASSAARYAAEALHTIVTVRRTGDAWLVLLPSGGSAQLCNLEASEAGESAEPAFAGDDADHEALVRDFLSAQEALEALNDDVPQYAELL